MIEEVCDLVEVLYYKVGKYVLLFYLWLVKSWHIFLDVRHNCQDENRKIV